MPYLSHLWIPGNHFWEGQIFKGFYFWEEKIVFGKNERWIWEMQKKNFKGRCQKVKLSKCEDVVRTYSAIQAGYALRLEGEYTSDFVCMKTDGDLMVRECVERKYLMKPMTVRLLDSSRDYWKRNGVEDWGLVINEE